MTDTTTTYNLKDIEPEEHTLQSIVPNPFDTDDYAKRFIKATTVINQATVPTKNRWGVAGGKITQFTDSNGKVL